MSLLLTNGAVPALPADPTAPAALTVPEAAWYLRMSRANIYRLFKSGALKPARIGGRTLVRRVDADALLARAVAS